MRTKVINDRIGSGISKSNHQARVIVVSLLALIGCRGDDQRACGMFNKIQRRAW